MPILSKQQLEALNQVSFPDNNTNYITPEILRNYNTDVIDTLVDSNDTGSFARTNITNTFTQTNNFAAISASSFVSASNFIGDGSRLTNITSSIALPILDEGVPVGNAVSMNFSGSAISAYIAAGVAIVSVNALDSASFNAYTASNDAKVNSLIAKTGSYATTGSNNFIGDQHINGDLYISGTKFIDVGDGSFRIIDAGNDITLLDAQNGVQLRNFTGNDIQIEQFANAAISIDNNSGSINISAHNLGQGIYLSASVIQLNNIDFNSYSSSVGTAITDLDTSASLSLYTASFDNGTRNLTFTKGDTTQFSVNIPDVSGSTDYTTTASFNSYTQSNDAKVNSLIDATGSYATTGSNTFVGTQIITGSNGSLTYTGTIDNPNLTLAEIHANDATPWLERFYNDTFSTTNSVMSYFGWDDGRFVFHNDSTQSIGIEVNGYNNPQLLIYENSASVKDDLNVGGTFRANQIDVSTGSIQQTTGSYVMTFSGSGLMTYDTYQNVATALQPYIQTGSVFETGSFITTGSASTARQSISGGFAFNTLYTTNLPLVAGQLGTNTVYLDYGDVFGTYSNEFQLWLTTNFAGVTVSGTGITNGTVTGYGFGGYFEVYITSGNTTGGLTYTFTGPADQTISITGSVIANRTIGISALNGNTVSMTQDGIGVSNSSGQAFNGIPGGFQLIDNNNGNRILTFAATSSVMLNGGGTWQGGPQIAIYDGMGDVSTIGFQSQTNYTDGRTTFLTPISASAGFTASLQNGYAWVGNGNNENTQVATSSFGSVIETGSFATTGSNSFNGDQTITGSLNVKTITTLENAATVATPNQSTGTLLIFNYNEYTCVPTTPCMNNVANAGGVGWVISGDGITDGTVTSAQYGNDGVEVNITSGNVVSGSSYIGTGPYYPTLVISGSAFSNESFNSPQGFNVQNLDGTGVQYGFNRISCQGADQTNLFSGIQIVGDTPEASMQFALSSYTPMYGPEPVPTFYAGGYYDAGLGYGSTDTTFTFYSSSIQVWHPIQFKTPNTPIQVTGSIKVSATITTNNLAISGSTTFSKGTGIGNVFLAQGALSSNTTGIGNTAIGQSAMNSNTTGNNNFAFGTNALQYNIAGNSNFAAGANAGRFASGSSNVFIGSDAGQYVTGSGNIIIGGFSGIVGTTYTNNIILADGGGNVRARYNSGWVFTGSVDIQNTFTASLANGYTWVGNSSNRSVLVATASFAGTTINTGSFVTTASFNAYTASQSTGSLMRTGSVSGNVLTFTKGDTTTFSLTVETGSINTGSFATTGSNQFNGNQTITGSLTISGSIISVDRNGNDTNVIIGNNALGMGNAGAAPLAIGNNISIAIGSNAMRYASGSQQNVAIGQNALLYTTGSNNFALGSEAMANNTDGSQNVAIGTGALNKNTTGIQNVSIGNDSGFVNVSGSKNTYIGAGAGNNHYGSATVIIGGYSGGGQILNDNIILSDGYGNIKAQYSASGSAWLMKDTVNFTTGSNAQAGTATLDGGNPGTVTVSNSLVTANSIIMLTKQTNTAPAAVSISAKSGGSFTITSTDNGDTDVVGWFIINNS